MTLNGRTYDITKQIAQYWLPALATLYYALAVIWHLPAQTEVVATITALDTFLGVILGISSKSYREKYTNATDAQYAGDIVVTQTADKKTFSLDVGIPVDQLDQQREVFFRVVNK